MNYHIISRSTQDILDADRILAHLNMGNSYPDADREDELVNFYTDAAIDFVQAHTNVPLIGMTVEMYYPTAQDYYNLKYHTADSVLSGIEIKYFDGTDTITYTGSKRLITSDLPNKVYAADIPSTATDITIAYTVVKQNPLPPAMVSAVLLVIGQFYENRAIVADDFIERIKDLLGPYTIRYSL